MKPPTVAELLTRLGEMGMHERAIRIVRIGTAETVDVVVHEPVIGFGESHHEMTVVEMRVCQRCQLASIERRARYGHMERQGDES